MTGKPRTFVFISQVYVPDPAAVGQHLADAAEELARRGNRVIVYTSSRGYDDPSATYPRREMVRGVDVRRIPLASFGKSSILIRVVGGLAFVAQAVARSLSAGRVDAVVVSTCPPMASLGALAIGALKRARVKYWVMDVNPDQTVVLGMARPTSASVRGFNWLNRRILGRADDVVVLDRFMAERINRKRNVSDKLTVLPPWPAEDPPEVVSHEANPFRRAHVPEGRIVLMYSGNHGPSNPVTTILHAARRVADDPRLLFMFIGGGVGKREVGEMGGANVMSLPYQPLSELRHSLAAADVHIVTVGDAIPGIVHPSKVYGAMAVARPILLVGPAENHVADILVGNDIGWHVRHGDVDGAERVLREIAAMPPAELRAKGRLAREVMLSRGGKAESVGRLCDVLERNV
ncbi:MAG: glycosyltransferase family 4 protein [Gemmatimonadaceae bacterium]|nr:glycosyltransferase family 4 protein [Gemmatimonadaceae bacterium]